MQVSDVSHLILVALRGDRQLPREAYIYRHVLKYLEKCSEPATTRDIVSSVDVPYSTVARIVRQLSREKRIKKHSGPGHSYLYSFITHDPPVGQRKLFTKELAESKAFEAEFLQKVTLAWVEHGWSPKSTDAAQQLLNALTRLYQLTWLEVKGVSPVDQADLDTCKLWVNEGLSLALNFAEFFQCLLATEDLWSSKTVTTFLYSGIDDVEQFVDQARRVSTALTQSNG